MNSILTKMKIYKFGTGDIVPSGSEYMTTVVEETAAGRLVWHYFLVTPN